MNTPETTRPSPLAEAHGSAFPPWQREFVERLRSGCPRIPRQECNLRLCDVDEAATERLLDDAAREIERLTRALLRIRDEDHCYRNDWWNIANEELGGTPNAPDQR